MDNEFYTLLTDRGMAKIASALADKKQIHLQKMAVGDGGGQYYEPTASQTKLRHEVWRGEMNTLTVAPNNPNWLIAELVLPEDVGGWYVREVGVFDDEGELIAIGKFPESYKPLLPGGCGKQVCIRLIMEVSNTTAVTLTVDPSIVLATRDYVDVRLDEHEHSTNHPDATLTQKGFTQLSNATDSDDETKAATPKAVKAAMAEARNQTHTWNQITGVPDGTLTQKGIVQLSSATDSTSTTEAATPSAVKAAMDKANAAAPANHTHVWNQVTGVPDGTLTQKGIVQLSSATDSTSTTEAATPSAVKAAMDKANAAAPANHTHVWNQVTGVPDGTLTQKGIVKLNNATDSTSTTEAATPSAVKAAMDKANAAISTSNADIRYLGNFAFFTENGTFTVPSGVTRVLVEMIGGGGGGGSGAEGVIEKHIQGYGGKASVLVSAVATVISGTQLPVVVGAGGNGAPLDTTFPLDGQNGGKGGTSSFSGINALGGNGGSGGIYFISTGGSMGEKAGDNGENSAYGIGGAGTTDGSNPGNGYGSGGSGGVGAWSSHRCTAGGKGSSGFVKLWW
ncbi:tail fiber protein [Salmonella enterica]|uniref:Phage tail protein n=3 Tax=Salmonella enterica TaxID=28901 RepID=A0A659P4F5_SALET|nr:tail fiber protein [Salmonella enterica]TGC64216.1 phage tail protein [Salmonella enterica subsp. enterica serovar Wilhelmsburg]